MHHLCLLVPHASSAGKSIISGLPLEVPPADTNGIKSPICQNSQEPEKKGSDIIFLTVAFLLSFEENFSRTKKSRVL